MFSDFFGEKKALIVAESCTVVSLVILVTLIVAVAVVVEKTLVHIFFAQL